MPKTLRKLQKTTKNINILVKKSNFEQIFLVHNPACNKDFAFIFADLKLKPIPIEKAEKLSLLDGYLVQKFILYPGDSLIIEDKSAQATYTITATKMGNILRIGKPDDSIEPLKKRQQDTKSANLMKDYSSYDYSAEATASKIFKFICNLYENYKKVHGENRTTLERFLNITLCGLEKGFSQATSLLKPLPTNIESLIYKTRSIILDGLKEWTEQERKRLNSSK